MRSIQISEAGRAATQIFLPVLSAPPRLCGSKSPNNKPEAFRKRFGNKAEAFRKQNGSASEAERKHFGSASEARNALFFEENPQFSFRGKKKTFAARSE
jgi:hypothetical protein